VHGTYFAFWPAIVAAGGLKRMGRNHVHCSTGVPDQDGEAVVSGMRRDAELLVYIDVERSMREEPGMKWWVSDNGVVLTEGLGEEGLVPARFFREVVGRKGDVGVLWRDGEWVADLPEGLRVVVPFGKGGRGGRGGRRGGRR
jgi:2'-phosphotransferase